MSKSNERIAKNPAKAITQAGPSIKQNISI
jgi:hypothetical protein